MDMKRGLAMEPVAVQEYCTLKNVNFFPCGFVVHPDAPWLGSSPDGIIFDPSVRPHFGFLEVKCPNVPSYVDCPYLKIQNGELKLKRSHAYACSCRCKVKSFSQVVAGVTLSSVHRRTS